MATRNSSEQAVRDSTIAADLIFLRTVLRWATRWQSEDGTSYLMKEDPSRGYTVPKARNPRRPPATEDRFQRVLAAAPKVMMAARPGARRSTRTYLPEVLVLVEATGRRYSAILALRYADLRLDVGQFGAIRWPADVDKCNQEWTAPLSAPARKAIDAVLQQRPGIGDAYLFPAITNASKPLPGDVASSWLRQAEKIAGVPKMDGSLWHAYRRKWVTERKHLPDADVAACGGWSDLSTLQTCYQQPDQATMQRVVSEPVRLRETPER